MGISAAQFAQMKERLSGTPDRAASRRQPSPATPPTPTQDRIILGVDPSLRGTGYGVLRLDRPHPVALTHGTIACPAGWERSRCLVRIAEVLRDVVKQHQPTVCVVEGLFYAQNLQTAIIMGEARGAALAAVGEQGLTIYEIAPRKVKQAVVGFGGAQKLAVARMVQRLLHLVELPGPDAADALALALAHAQTRNRPGSPSPKRL